jgi:AraC-like DNA-binding protein
MTYEDFISDLPLGGAAMFRSAEEEEEALRRLGVSHEIRQLGAGRFRSHLASFQTDQAEFAADRYSVACSFWLTPLPGTVCLLLARSAGDPIRALGTELNRRRAVVIPSGCGVEIAAPHLSGSEALCLSQEQFDQLLSTFCPDARIPRETVVLKGDGEGAESIRRGILAMLWSSDRAPINQFVSAVLASAITWVGDCLTRPEFGRLHHEHRGDRVARKARAFIVENYRQQVDLEDLCRTTAVSARTLQRYFHEYLGMSPTEYLRATRFEAAKRALKKGHASDRTVSEIALDHGFSHLGRFSVEFRKRFGCSPRDLLSGRE